MINQTAGYPKEFDRVTKILIVRGARRHKSVANSDLGLNKCRIYSSVWQLTATGARENGRFSRNNNIQLFANKSLACEIICLIEIYSFNKKKHEIPGIITEV